MIKYVHLFWGNKTYCTVCCVSQMCIISYIVVPLSFWKTKRGYPGLIHLSRQKVSCSNEPSHQHSDFHGFWQVTCRYYIVIVTVIYKVVVDFRNPFWTCACFRSAAIQVVVQCGASNSVSDTGGQSYTQRPSNTRAKYPWEYPDTIKIHPKKNNNIFSLQLIDFWIFMVCPVTNLEFWIETCRAQE